jgi:hypothetical protein
MKKYHNKTNVLLVIALVSLVVLGFKATSLQNQVDQYESEKSEVSTLLFNGAKVKGYSCGVLTTNRAKELLDSTSLKTAYGQGPSNQIQSHNISQESLFWSDSCRYEDASDSSKYVELYVTTFQSDNLARLAFPDFLGQVNDAVELPASPYGEVLFYDGGAYYLLNKNIVIQIASSNGNPTEIDEFSKNVFDQILQNF